MPPITRTRLTRKVRIALPTATTESIEWTNNWVGGPTTDWLVPNIEVNVTIANRIDERTGYIEDITVIDHSVRRVLQEWLNQGNMPSVPSLWLREFSARLIDRYPEPSTVYRIELVISPQWSFAMEQEKPSMIHVTRQYEFSAAHRLHSHQLSSEENQALYGKCNRPHGHGHNYLLDVSVSGELDDAVGVLLPAATIDRIVKEKVIARLDHHYLNQEVDPFRELNPTVENIASTIWNWLDGAFAPAQLERIRVYETAKTWADICCAG